MTVEQLLRRILEEVEDLKSEVADLKSELSKATSRTNNNISVVNGNLKSLTEKQTKDIIEALTE